MAIYQIQGADLVAERNAFISGRARQGLQTTTGSAAQTLTLTALSFYTQVLTGTGVITVVLPAANATNVGIGTEFRIINDSNVTAPVTLNGGTALGTIAAGETAEVVCKTAADAAGTWEFIAVDKDENDFVKFNVTLNTNSAPTAGASWSAAVNGDYTASIPAATHMRGTTPFVEIRDANGDVPGLDLNIAATGDVTITVNETPDGRRAYRVTIV